MNYHSELNRNIEAGDIIVVLRDRACGAHSPSKPKENVQVGEKIHVEKIDYYDESPSHNTIDYKLSTGGTNSLVCSEIEKIYYNDIFKTAWGLFGGRL